MPALRDVSKTELAVLQILWAGGEVTIREIADELYPGGDASEYATVQRLLDRLEAKGFVTRDRSTRAHRFRARVRRADYLRHRLLELADRLCAGSLAPLLTELVQAQKLTAAERNELRRIIERSTQASSQDRPGSEEDGP